MGTRGLLFCLALSLVLVSIYSQSVFENMKDLKEKTNFGKNFPRQGLLLLCWLLRQGKIDQNGKLRLNFNPAQKPFGIHQYKNYDLAFPDLSNTNFEYFSLGNLWKPKAKQLPDFIIRNICTSRDHPQSNTDRIVIRIQKDNPTVVDEVYITQHAEDINQGSDYVQEHTHLIDKQLLKIIEKLCRPDGDSGDRKRGDEDPDHQGFQKIQNMFSNEPYLHVFLHQAGYDADKEVSEHATCNPQARSNHLELISTPDGQARILWDGIPDELLKEELKIGVYQDEHEDDPLVEYPLDGRPNGQIDTHLALNRGLQVRLLKPITVFETVHKSRGFDDGGSETDDAVPGDPVESHPFYSFTTLFSLLLCPFSHLFSLVYFTVSNLFSLVYFTVSNLFSLVCCPFYLFSLVSFTVSYLFSLLLFICQEIVYDLGKLIVLVCSIFLKLVVVLLSIILIGFLRRVILDLTDSRPRAAPPFVVVSHGRPGF